ncbi:MAG: hypothetical protein ACRBBK_07385 [Paracoccaceae bacterium]
MFLDTAKIDGRTLTTHRSRFLLDRITASDVQRPLLSMASVPTIGATAFTVGFADILYAGEIVALLGSACAWVLLSASIGQLKLVSSDLRGSEVSGAVWGSYRHLKSIHHDITRVWDDKEVSDAPQ